MATSRGKKKEAPSEPHGVLPCPAPNISTHSKKNNFKERDVDLKGSEKKNAFPAGGNSPSTQNAFDTQKSTVLRNSSTSASVSDAGKKKKGKDKSKGNHRSKFKPQTMTLANTARWHIKPSNTIHRANVGRCENLYESNPVNPKGKVVWLEKGTTNASLNRNTPLKANNAKATFGKNRAQQNHFAPISSAKENDPQKKMQHLHQKVPMIRSTHTPSSNVNNARPVWKDRPQQRKLNPDKDFNHWSKVTPLKRLIFQNRERVFRDLTEARLMRTERDQETSMRVEEGVENATDEFQVNQKAREKDTEEEENDEKGKETLPIRTPNTFHENVLLTTQNDVDALTAEYIRLDAAMRLKNYRLAKLCKLRIQKRMRKMSRRLRANGHEGQDRKTNGKDESVDANLKESNLTSFSSSSAQTYSPNGKVEEVKKQKDNTILTHSSRQERNPQNLQDSVGAKNSPPAQSGGRPFIYSNFYPSLSLLRLDSHQFAHLVDRRGFVLKYNSNTQEVNEKASNDCISTRARSSDHQRNINSCELKRFTRHPQRLNDSQLMEIRNAFSFQTNGAGVITNVTLNMSTNNNMSSDSKGSEGRTSANKSACADEGGIVYIPSLNHIRLHYNMHRQTTLINGVPSGDSQEMDVKDSTAVQNAPYIRSYVTNLITDQLDDVCFTFLQQIFHVQSKLRETQPLHFKARMRYCSGLREVQRAIRSNKAKLVIIAPDIEPLDTESNQTTTSITGGKEASVQEPKKSVTKSNMHGNAAGPNRLPLARQGLNGAIETICESCQRNGIPYVFSMSRQRLSYALFAKGSKVSCVAILSAEGAHDGFHALLRLGAYLKQKYVEEVEPLV